MCFSGEMSAAFAACGVLVALIAYTKLNALGGAAQRGAGRFVTGVLYFVLMETLQAVSYWWGVDDGSGKLCNRINSHLTIAGFAHICFQPYFTHLMCGAFFHPDGKKGIQNQFTLKLALLAGVAFFMRYVLAVHIKPDSYMPLDGKACPNTEWIRASTLTPGGAEVSCTFKGLYHLAWSVPMYQPTYFSPSVFIHSFMMFAPFLVTPGIQSKLFGLFLFCTGPAMAAFISENLNEQASIWCFFSIAQITCMFIGVLAMGSDKDAKGNAGAGKAARKKRA